MVKAGVVTIPKLNPPIPDMSCLTLLLTRDCLPAG
jgi:hypothetical protein